MHTAADESRIDNPGAAPITRPRSFTSLARFAQPLQLSRSTSTANRKASPYLPESNRRRRMMLVSVALVCLGLLGPYLVRMKEVDGSWQVSSVHVNAATILGQEFVYLMFGLGLLLIAAALCWGHGLRHAGLLSLVIAISVPIMAILGLAAYLDIAMRTPSVSGYQTYVVWTYFLAYPAAVFTVMLSLRHGAWRA